MKVLILADTHFDDRTRHLHYPASEKAVDGFERWLSETTGGFDLIAICGDITVKGTTHISEHESVKSMMDKVGTPYLIIPGNHDMCPIKGMEKRYPDLEEYEYTELENTLFYRVFGEMGVRYSKIINGIRFIGFAIRNDDPDGQLEWLSEELVKPEKKIVIGHYPLEKSRTGGYCSWWGYERINGVIDDLKILLGSERHNVLAYFCGHQHINSIVPMGSTYQIETASVVLGTNSYRILEIADNKLHISTHRLPYIIGYSGDLTLPEKSIDEEHITVHEYHYGNSKDLSFQRKF
jgi:Icc-related predicted phosphoesterase